jgi:glutamyl-tRNA synthetase
MVNFLALLGWSPGDDRELLSKGELIESFALEGISGGNAVFNPEKLDWMNGQYIAKMPIGALAEATRPFFEGAGLGTSRLVADPGAFHRLLELLRPRAKRLTDFVEGARPLLMDTVEYEPDAVTKHLASPDLADHLAALVDALRTTTPFDESHVEAAVRTTAAARGIKAGPLIHATRVAVTGRTASPGLFEVLALVGRAGTLARLEALLTFLSSREPRFS